MRVPVYLHVKTVVAFLLHAFHGPRTPYILNIVRGHHFPESLWLPWEVSNYSPLPHF